MPRQTTTPDNVLDLYPEEMQPSATSTNGHSSETMNTSTISTTGTLAHGEEGTVVTASDKDQQYNLIVRQLDQSLDRRLVKQRKGYGEDENGRQKMLSYLEHHTITRALNRIFGYGNWGAETIDVHDFFEDGTSGVPRAVRVTVRLTVFAPGFNAYAPITKTGYATVRGSKWAAYEMALGNAEAKAFKRCAAQYGDQFGLSLYSDEEEETVASVDTETESPTKRSSSSTPARRTTGSTVEPQGGAPRYADNEAAECEECGKEIRGYTNRNTGKTYTTQDLVNMSWKQSNGHVLCLDCRRN